jgi:hypothetical protein
LLPRIFRQPVCVLLFASGLAFHVIGSFGIAFGFRLAFVIRVRHNASLSDLLAAVA